MFHPSRCITHPFLTDEAIRRRNTNTREMGLATICRPPHTTERDKLEEILKQKERGVLHCILWESDSPLTLYANMLLDTNCIGWCNGQNHMARYCVLLNLPNVIWVFTYYLSFLEFAPQKTTSWKFLFVSALLSHCNYHKCCSIWVYIHQNVKDGRKIIKDAKYEGKQH